MTATALQTSYAGCRFRSRTEARWAVALDHLGVRWEYEPQGYLVDGQPYLPDFWLPALATFLEVKGSTPSRDEDVKAAALCETTGHRVLIVYGDIPNPDSLDDYGVPRDRSGWMDRWDITDGTVGWDNRHVWCYCPRCGCVGVEYEGRSERIDCPHHAWAGSYSCKDRPNGDKTHTGRDTRILDAYTAGRSARFEHGDTGTPAAWRKSTRAQDPPLLPSQRPARLSELLAPTLNEIRRRTR